MASEGVAIDDREARRMLDALDAKALRAAAGEAVRKAALKVRRGVQEKVKAVAGAGRGKDYFRARGFGRLRMVKTSSGWHHTGPLYKDVKMFTYRKNRPAGANVSLLNRKGKWNRAYVLRFLNQGTEERVTDDGKRRGRVTGRHFFEAGVRATRNAAEGQIRGDLYRAIRKAYLKGGAGR